MFSYDGLLYGAYPGGFDPRYPDDLSYDEFGGVGFISGMIPDTHFRFVFIAVRLFLEIRIIFFHLSFWFFKTSFIRRPPNCIVFLSCCSVTTHVINYYRSLT